MTVLDMLDEVPLAAKAVACPAGDAKLLFVRTDRFGKLCQHDRKAIKQRAANGKGRPKRVSISSKPRIGSWLTQDVTVHTKDMLIDAMYPSLSMFPGLSARTLEKVYSAFAELTRAFYPQTFCSIFQSADTSWFVYLHQDPVHCYVYPYIAESYFHPKGQRAAKLLARLLPAIQANLEDSRSVATDSTISAVLSLASGADVANDTEGLKKHVHGLHSILKLRGGIPGLYHPWLQTKCCRVDLQLALYTWSKPLFFRDNICWDPFFINEQDTSDTFTEFLSTVHDTRLRHVLADTREFCTIANLAHVTGRRMKPQLFQEIMVSLQYRLLHLGFDDLIRSAADEALRLAVLSFTTTIFLQVAGIETRYSRLAARFKSALVTLETQTTECSPHAKVWMLVAASISLSLTSHKWLRIALSETVGEAHISEWSEMKRVLKKFFWVDVIHDAAGKAVFENASSNKTR